MNKKIFYLLFCINITFAFDPIFVVGPNLFFSQSENTSQKWHPHYGLETSLWFENSMGEDLRGRLYGVCLGYDLSKTTHSTYLQVQSWIHNPLAKEPTNFPPGISFGPVWSFSRETGDVDFGLQFDVWVIVFGGGGYRNRANSNSQSTHQYGLMARIPFVD
jgi:hypothetical protein